MNSDLPLKDAMKLASRTFHKPKQSRKGKGVYQDVINLTNRMIGSKAKKLTNSEYHLPDSNYSGPGTDLKNKVDSNVPCLNQTDCCSRKHDIDYNEAMKISDPRERARHIRFADEVVKDCYGQIKGEPFLSTAAKAGIQIKNTFENTIPSLAKRTEGMYYGSKDGNGLMEGEAKRAIFNSIYKK